MQPDEETPREEYINAVIDAVFDALVPDSMPDWAIERASKGFDLDEDVESVGSIIAERIRNQK